MRVRIAAPLALAAAVAMGTIAPADAAPKKKKPPITKTYELTMAPFPDPREGTGCASPVRTDGQFMDVEEIKVTGAGVLDVKVTKFRGDWDMSLADARGAAVAQGSGTSTPNTSTAEQTESLKYKSKKAQTLYLRVCNFLGSPTATVTYTYTYN